MIPIIPVVHLNQIALFDAAFGIEYLKRSGKQIAI